MLADATMLRFSDAAAADIMLPAFVDFLRVDYCCC